MVSGSFGFNPKLGLGNFELSDILLQQECEHVFASGNYSCLNGYFKLNRIVGYYILHGYLPSILCVLISWLSFWVQLDVAPGLD